MTLFLFCQGVQGWEIRYSWIVVQILVKRKFWALKNKMPYPLGKKYLASFWWQTTNGSTSISVIPTETRSFYMPINGSRRKYILVPKFIYILKQRENCCSIHFLCSIFHGWWILIHLILSSFLIKWLHNFW